MKVLTPYSPIDWFAALSPPSWTKTLDKESLNAFPNTPILPKRGLKLTTGKLSNYIKTTAQEEFKIFEQNINRLTKNCLLQSSYTSLEHYVFRALTLNQAPVASSSSSSRRRADEALPRSSNGSWVPGTSPSWTCADHGGVVPSVLGSVESWRRTTTSTALS